MKGACLSDKIQSSECIEARVLVEEEGGRVCVCVGGGGGGGLRGGQGKGTIAK